MSINDKLDKYFKSIIAVIATALGIFHLLNVSGVIAMSTLPIRVIHVGALLTILFLNPGKKSNVRFRGLNNIIKVIFAGLTILVNVYLLNRWEAITSSGNITNQVDIIMGIIMIIIVLEATRRSVGLVLSLIAAVFLAYPFIGPYLPAMLQSRNYTINRIFGFLYASTEGVYGVPMGVSATYIILFCIYGSFLSEFGAGQFLYKLSLSMTKKYTAAMAKTSIIFSALIGMISGSAAGNVAITGSLTIPMMVKEGYTKDEAGAVSAVAATGGQIMPPIMGAAAFIMAELINMSYANIMKAAALPAILYFLSIFVITHLEAKKKGLKPLDVAEYREITFTKTVKEGWYYLIPILALIAMLVLGYSPFKGAFYSIVALLIVYIIAEKKFDKDLLKKTIDAIRKGSMDTVSIATACAASGIIVGILSITGLGSKLSAVIIAASNGSLIIALILTMLTSIVLGMGLPTTAAYLVLASVVVPALVKMGTSLLGAHMFVFFFGCISTITPPVALASYVAAGIAGADLNKVGWKAFKYGLVSFILPYLFVYGPSLLMDGTVFEIILTTIKGVIGIFVVGASIVGFYRVNLKAWQRIFFFVGGICLIAQGTVTDIAGVVLLGASFATILVSSKKTISA